MTQYTKLEAATVQLDKAIQLFLTGEYLCALTLAGAAEDILASLSKLAGNDVALDHIAAGVVIAFEEAGQDPITLREVGDILNAPRNSAKHANREQLDLDVNESDVAVLLLRAVPMARGLGARTYAQDAFEKWRTENL
jgi:hypothetical protein